jgi:hypothetical protein
MRREYTTAEYRQIVASIMKEKEWMQEIIQIARWLNYLAYHTYDSRRSEFGYPDLTLCRLPPRPRFVLIEAKTEKGRLTPSQKTWLEGAQAAGIEAYIFRPSDRDRLIEILKRD